MRLGALLMGDSLCQLPEPPFTCCLGGDDNDAYYLSRLPANASASGGSTTSEPAKMGFASDQNQNVPPPRSDRGSVSDGSRRGNAGERPERPMQAQGPNFDVV